MTKPNSKDFGEINGIFPTEQDKIKYDLQKTLYLSWKRKDNKQCLINEVVNTIMSNSYEYSDIIIESLERNFKNCTNAELKTWL